MRHEITLLLFILGVLFFLAACASDRPGFSGSGGGGGGGTIGPNPMPVVQINPWTRPPSTDPVVLSVTISNTGSHAYLVGTSPTQTRVVVTGFDGSGISLGSQTVNFNPTGWGDGTRTISLEPATTLIGKSRTLKFEVFINCQRGAEAIFVISDTEP